mmetsp:Transcript_91779/g.203768  ORF Transcript_91779/g.203768 Transcript_91779/m.203768 type:complete len:263 (+) Transcript_91779:262-1050(+)
MWRGSLRAWASSKKRKDGGSAIGRPQQPQCPQRDQGGHRFSGRYRRCTARRPQSWREAPSSRQRTRRHLGSSRRTPEPSSEPWQRCGRMQLIARSLRIWASGGMEEWKGMLLATRRGRLVTRIIRKRRLQARNFGRWARASRRSQRGSFCSRRRESSMRQVERRPVLHLHGCAFGESKPRLAPAALSAKRNLRAQGPGRLLQLQRWRQQRKRLPRCGHACGSKALGCRDRRQLPRRRRWPSSIPRRPLRSQTAGVLCADRGT